MKYSFSRRKMRHGQLASCSEIPYRIRLIVEQLEARNLLDAGLISGDLSAPDSGTDNGQDAYADYYVDSGSFENELGGNDGPTGDYPDVEGPVGGSDDLEGPPSEDYPDMEGPTGGLFNDPFVDFRITGISPDRGESDSDLITNSEQITVLGTGQAGSAFWLYADGTYANQGIVQADGTWSASIPQKLTEGPHIISVEPDSEFQTGMYVEYLTIDLTPDKIKIEVPEFTNKKEALLTVEIESDEVFPSTTFSIDVDLDENGLFDSAGERDFYVGEAIPGWKSEFRLPELPQGTYLVRGRIMDYAGNVAVTDSLKMQVDPNAGIIGSQMLRDLYNDYLALSNGGNDGFSYGQGDDGAWYDGGDPFMGMDGDFGDDGDLEAGAEESAPDLQPLVTKYPYLRFDDKTRVQVNVRVTLLRHIAALKEELEGMGMVVQQLAPAQNLIIGHLPVAKIGTLPNLRYFAAVTPVLKPVTHAGSVAAQGDGPMLSDSFTSDFRADGTGIKVGLLSDSVNHFGGGLAASQATGDLPAVQVLLDQPGTGGIDEGRAMLEIIHDIAPGADLAFHTAFISPQSFASGVQALASAGSRVLVDDIGYFNQPLFNDGVVSLAVEAVSAAGVVYVSAAGNDADAGFLDTWRGTTATVGSGATAVSGTFHDFGGGDILQNFSLPVNGVLVLSFQWNAAFLEGGSASPNFQVPNDIDIYITDSTGNTVFEVINTNNMNTDEAFEFVLFLQNDPQNTNRVTDFGMAFRLAAGPAPTRVKWISFGNDPQAQGQGGPTIFAQAAARSALTVGAAPWYAPTSAEPFTSLGGNLEYFFDGLGNPLSTPEIRPKPEITAPDLVNTTFFGQDIPQDGDTFPNFIGTSAAAPHAAAAVALLLSEAGVPIPPATVIQHLQNTALDIGTPGFDFLTGAGLIQLTEGIPLPFDPRSIPDELIRNDTSDRALDLGTLVDTFSLAGQSIRRHDDGLVDYDWFRFTPSHSGSLTISLSDFTTASGGDIHFRLFALRGGVLIQLGSSTRTSGVESQTLTTTVLAGDILLLYVYGYNFEQALYDLLIDLD